MNASTPATSVRTVPISGRISVIDWYPPQKPTRFTTLIRLKAADEYTTPDTVQVISDTSLGDEGEIVDIVCEVRGRYRSYTVKDKQSGEERTVRTADNLLICNARG